MGFIKIGFYLIQIRRHGIRVYRLKCCFISLVRLKEHYVTEWGYFFSNINLDDFSANYSLDSVLR